MEKEDPTSIFFLSYGVKQGIIMVSEKEPRTCQPKIVRCQRTQIKIALASLPGKITCFIMPSWAKGTIRTGLNPLQRMLLFISFYLAACNMKLKFVHGHVRSYKDELLLLMTGTVFVNVAFGC